MTPGCPFAYFWQVRPSHFVYNFSILAAAGRPQKKGLAKKKARERCKMAKTKRESGQHIIDKASSADFAWPAPNYFYK